MADTSTEISAAPKKKTTKIKKVQGQSMTYWPVNLKLLDLVMRPMFCMVLNI